MGLTSINQPVTISTTVTVKDTNGVDQLTDPTSISLRVQRPDLTTVTYGYNPGPIIRDSVGRFRYVLSFTQSGVWKALFQTDGTGEGEPKLPQVFNVYDPLTVPMHLDYEDVKARLNVTALTDYELQDMMVSAVSEQENSVGAVAPRTVTETVSARYGRLDLSTRPVLSVVSATVSGSAVSTSGWTIPSAMAGLVELGTGAWWGGSGSSTQYAVTYTAGRQPVPQDLVEAALLRVQRAYDTQRGPAGMPLAVEQDSGFGSSYPLLLRAQDLERPYVLPSVA